MSELLYASVGKLQLAVLLQWAWAYLGDNPGARVITGGAAGREAP